MIHIEKSPTADTRTCDWKTVSEDQLWRASVTHISDVQSGLAWFAEQLERAGQVHDADKLTRSKQFHADFQTGFKRHEWWDNHRKVNRHHIDKPDGVPVDVNLIDVLEHIVDCVMAGMARSGSVYDLHLPGDLLETAFQNTAKLLKAQVRVKDGEGAA